MVSQCVWFPHSTLKKDWCLFHRPKYKIQMVLGKQAKVKFLDI